MVGLLIILGIVAVCVFIQIYLAKKGYDPFFLGVFAAIIGGTGIILWILIPTKYSDWELIKEKRLVSLYNNKTVEGSGFIFVHVTEEDTYTYRYEIESEFSTGTSKEYVVESIKGCRVIESEDPNCKQPALRTYQKNGVPSKWSLGVLPIQQYVFYVPEGTIVKEIKLK